MRQRPRRPPPPPVLSVGCTPLPPLSQQQENVGRISGAKPDPSREDEETAVTSLPTRGSQKYFSSPRKPAAPEKMWPRGKVTYTNTLGRSRLRVQSSLCHLPQKQKLSPQCFILWQEMQPCGASNTATAFSACVVLVFTIQWTHLRIV